MDNLFENKIREHAPEIFGSEPVRGHRERFAGKLQAATGGKKQVPIRRIISYMAVAAIFAGCIFIFRDIFMPDYPVETESPAEVQTYYSMQLQEKIDDIEPLLQRMDEQDRATLMHDIEAMQQEADTGIQDSDDKDIDLIVTTYTSKIEALEHINYILSANY
jgi:hypothetical protein